MVELPREMRIKQRDHWSCRRCGKKFEDLVICQHVYPATSDDHFITLCNKCIDWAFDNPSEAVIECEKLLRRNKIVLIGDCHGNFERLNTVLTDEMPFDFFLSVGDVGTLRDVTPDNINIIDRWQDKGHFVFGNHDNCWFFNQLALHQDINGVSVAGLNGMLKSRTFLKEQPNNISFREIMYLSHLNDIDILVTHQPPTGMFDNAGEFILEELLNYLVPKIYISGHIHKYKLKFHLNTFMISLPMITNGYAVAYFQGRDLRDLEVVMKKGRRYVRI